MIHEVVSADGTTRWVAVVYTPDRRRKTRGHPDRAVIERWALDMEAAKLQPKGMREASIKRLLRELPARVGTPYEPKRKRKS